MAVFPSLTEVLRGRFVSCFIPCNTCLSLLLHAAIAAAAVVIAAVAVVVAALAICFLFPTKNKRKVAFAADAAAIYSSLMCLN